VYIGEKGVQKKRIFKKKGVLELAPLKFNFPLQKKGEGKGGTPKKILKPFLK